ncbi:hypothetical protein H9L39_18580 [Fusarium oxysporum f. sp. albedinis]|nr:hypothetical protein H9L39_18580 [Fusarium oxysporum f. sp. albedinis]
MDPRFDRRRPRHTGGPSSHEGALSELSQCQDGSVSLLPHTRLVENARDGLLDLRTISNSNVWESIIDQMNQVLGPLIMSSRGILLIGQRIQDVRMFSERQPSQHRHGQECTNALDVSAVEVDYDRGYYLVSAT